MGHDLGNFSKYVLLTGAGFTKNWGMKLASEMNNHIFSYPMVNKDLDLKALILKLMNNKNFEDIYSEAKKEFPDKINLMTDAIKDIFNQFQQMPLWGSNNAPREDLPYEGKIMEFLFKFHKPHDSQYETSFLFTLNQDLFLERLKWRIGSYPIICPGINPDRYSFKQEALFNNSRLEHYTTYPKPDSEIQDIQLKGQVNYIKLHGSANWYSKNNQDILIIGTSEEKTGFIHGSVLLKKYLDIFEQVLLSGQIKLMVIGYSFGDSHINKTIDEACQSHELELHIWDINSNVISNLTDPMKKALKGIYVEPLTNAFKQHEDILTKEPINRFFS